MQMAIDEAYEGINNHHGCPFGTVIVKDGVVRMVNVTPPASNTVDRIIDLVPQVMDRVDAFIDKQKTDS